MKKLIVLTIAAAFSFSMATLAFAETITRISGDRITVRDNAGKEKTVVGNAHGLKVGDRVKLNERNGRTWLDPQPEPPSPKKIKKHPLKPSALGNRAPATPEAPPPPPPPPPPDKPKMK